MLFERVEAEGLAHYSYLIGYGDKAVVIDPRRDVDAYMQKASKRGVRITDILETHSHEDFVVGSGELASLTGAAVWHADSQWKYGYGRPVQDGQVWRLDSLRLEALSSPGHTPGSMSYLLYDPEGHPWMLFSGDALFAGDVGRVDLFGMDRARELAGLLHHTVFERFLPLGDGIIVCPAHGEGSVCGGAIAERTWTTLGMERRFNPKLRYRDREGFIDRVAFPLERPPYFDRMEQLNRTGAPVIGAFPVPAPLSPDEFEHRARESIVLDTRMPPGFGAAHVPDALSIWQEGLPSFAGWFLPYDKPLLLVNEADDPTPVMRSLLRLGYDRVAGYLAGGMLAWYRAGRRSVSSGTITVHDACRRLDEDRKTRIIDVRGDDELAAEGEITGAYHIHITQLPEHLDEIPEQPVFIFCGSGLRSTIAASILQRNGWRDVTVVLGGTAAWSSISCPLEKPQRTGVAVT